ncbi:MAG: hypothetical protein JSV22_06770 [Bacteroidales bacterium]|nr:MAG: hypothetical protein JSV22_06770 [Bacteroidales bacterium]
MAKNKLLLVFILISNILYGQSDLKFTNISEMKWEIDYQVYLKMKNDSSYTFDIRQLFHIREYPSDTTVDFIFYPVNLGKEYINNLAERTGRDSAVSEQATYKTLWGALHESLGGGWVHFINCMLYSLETQQLDLTAPLMKRPATQWKPDPITDTYQRTKKWEYYIPVDQKLAIKEYKLRIKRNEPGDLRNIPGEYIELFKSTNNSDYIKYIENEEFKLVAKIDLVKIILGANFLGEIQIDYIRNQVLNSVRDYSANRLPSILVFDEFDAAAAISLDLNGYRLESLAFKSSANLSTELIEERRKEINRVIEDINIYNQNSFRRQLLNYYK